MTTENTSGATHIADNTWKDNSGSVFTTPSYSPPESGTKISIYDGNGNSDCGTWLNGRAVKDKAGS